MEIRDYTNGDERKILELFKIVFKKEMPLEYWTWRFINNPLNKIQIKLMFDEDKLVGHYAVSPQVLIVNGKKYSAALSMTTMTHPDYAGKGIFTKLASSLYNDFSTKNELDIVYGFPNDNSNYAFINKLGWTDICTVITLSSRNFKTVSDIGCSTVTHFTDDHYHAYIQSVNNYTNYLDRSSSWFNWRYFANSSNNYISFEFVETNVRSFIVGKLFSINNEHELDICELIDNGNKSNILISALVNYFSNKKINKINVWVPSQDSRIKELTKIGFLATEHSTHFGFKCLSDNVKVNQNSFYFSMGDSDIY